MEIKQVSVMPVLPGTITELDKAKLAEIGVIVIEHECPESIRMIRPEAEISGSGLLFAALSAIQEKAGVDTKTMFANLVMKQVLKTLEKPRP